MVGWPPAASPSGELLMCGQDQILDVRAEFLCQLGPGFLRLRALTWFRFVMLLKLNFLLNMVFLVEITGLGKQAG